MKNPRSLLTTISDEIEISSPSKAKVFFKLEVWRFCFKTMAPVAYNGINDFVFQRTTDKFMQMNESYFNLKRLINMQPITSQWNELTNIRIINCIYYSHLW